MNLMENNKLSGNLKTTQLSRFATAQGKQGIWKSIFPDRVFTNRY